MKASQGLERGNNGKIKKNTTGFIQLISVQTIASTL